MTQKKALLITLTIATVSGFGLWRLATVKKKVEVSDAAKLTNSPEAPANPTHEIASLQEQLKKKPGHGPILLRLAELERQAGKNEDAIKHLREAAASDTNDNATHLELGKALFEAGDINSAISETKKILDTDAHDADALYNLGAIHANVNQFSEARDYWNKLVKVSPDSESGRKAKAGLQTLDSKPPMPQTMPAGHPPIPPGTVSPGATAPGSLADAVRAGKW